MAEEFGAKIRAARLEAGMTQKQLGDRCGISDVTIRKYESGKVHPKIETLSKIAAALGVPLSYFVPTDTPGDYWHSIKVSEPKDGDERYVPCMVSVVDWYTPFQTTEKKFREFVVEAIYDTQQKIFRFCSANVTANALLDPDDRSEESGFRVTHWTEKPEPAGVLREEAEQHD